MGTRRVGGPRSAPGTLVGVSRVVVDVVLKPEISDPQGQAVLGALGRLGHDVHGWALGRNVGPTRTVIDGRTVGAAA